MPAKISVNVWRITGYKGWDDYDGPEDNNTHILTPMDARLTKEMVEEFFCNHYLKKYRVVSLSAECVATREIGTVMLINPDTQNTG